MLYSISDTSMIRRIAKRVRDDSLLRDSAIIFTTSLIANVISYVFQLYLGRALGPADYGVFAAVVSLLYIASVPAAAVNTSIAKFVSGFRGRKEFGKAKHLFFRGLRKAGLYGAAGLVAISVLSPFIASFLNMAEIVPIVILGVIFFGSLLNPVCNGTLSGLQRFKALGAVDVFGSVVKLVFGVALVSIGLGVDGALLAYFIGGLGGFVLAVFLLRGILSLDSVSFDRNSIMTYTHPVFFSALLVCVISNIDVVLVKHYFPAEVAGHYAAAAVLAKIVFFVSGAISGVMFSKAAELSALGKDTRKLLRDALFYTFLLSFAVVALYFVAPYFVVSMLFGARYADAVPLMGLFGLAMGLFALSSVLVSYNLAVGRTKIVYVLLVSTLLEIGLIVLFHGTLLAVVKIVLFTMAFVFASMLMMTKNEFSRMKKDALIKADG